MTARAHSSVTIIDVSTVHYCLREILEPLMPEDQSPDRTNLMVSELIEDIVTEQVYMRSKWTEPREYESKLARELMQREDEDDVCNVLNSVHELLCEFLDTQSNHDWSVYRCTVSHPRCLDNEREVTDGLTFVPTNLYIQELGDYRILQWEKANGGLLLPNGSLKRKVR